MTDDEQGEGPFWCGRCGVRRTTVRGASCGFCRAQPTVDQFACGVCGKRAWFMYVYGYRCHAHETVWEPSQGAAGERAAACWGQLLAGE